MRNEDERRYGRSPPSGRGGRSYDYFGREGGPREYDDEHSGAHGLEPWERLRSRSADPGQSSYGGFTNEDPRYQSQQFPHRRSGQESSTHGRGGGVRGAYPDPGEGFRERRITPRGYTRSDERVREDVCERLSYSGLDVSDVSVQVSQGRVTLEGSVASRRDKHAVEDCVDDCLRVEDVDNRIRVARPEASGSGNDI